MRRQTKVSCAVPSGTKIYHKTGSVAKIRTDAGIIETPGGAIALCVLTENNADTSWTADNAGDRLCAQIAKVSYDYFAAGADKATQADASESDVVRLTKDRQVIWWKPCNAR